MISSVSESRARAIGGWSYTRHKKDKWDKGESLAHDHYIRQWCLCLSQNYTIRGGEIDLIMQKGDHLFFVEVKVVDAMDDYFDYITPAKKRHLQRSIKKYLHQHPIFAGCSYQVDVVFVKYNEIELICENVFLS